jgi:conjugative transposon TraM protein
MNSTNDKQKKMLLVLPLLAIPFATLFFWALGGGKVNAQTDTGKLKGLNMQLPGAKLKNDSTENKLSFYEQAEKDSLKFKQARKDDPYYKSDTAKVPAKSDSISPRNVEHMPGYYGSTIGKSFSHQSLNSSSASLAADEQQINLKLAALNRQINQPPAPQQQPLTGNEAPVNNSDSELSRLQAQMQKLNNANAPDPQMQQLSGMLDKIEEIQNPALAREKAKAQSEKERGTVLPVSASGNEGEESVMNGASGVPDSGTVNAGDYQENGFYDLEHADQNATGNSVAAVVHQTQTLTSGSTIKLRLLQDIYVNGRLIPKDNFVFGTCSVEGERLNIDVKTIRYRNSVFPVSLKVFDQDGLSGIYVPGAITRDAVKEGTDEAVQSYDPMSYDPSLGAQAATAGIQVAKGIFSKKVRLIKVVVKAGYSVLLLNGKQLNQ